MTTRRPTAWTAAIVAGTAIAALALPAGAAGAPPPPADLRVADDDGWRATNSFELRWDNPPGMTIASAHYLIRNPLGETVVGPAEIVGPEINAPVPFINGISVPKGGGAYTAMVWLEDADGAQGAAADAKLRYDPERPGPVVPIQPSGWISRNELPYPLRLTRPPGAPPLSGIRGYAVSVDRWPSSSPCADSFLCADLETDLSGGPADDTLLLTGLPEGRLYAHAVAVSGSWVRSESPGHAPLRVDTTDPATVLTGLPRGWTNRPVTLGASATDELSGMGAGAGGAPFTAIQVDGAPPVVAAGGSAATTVAAAGIHTISYYARDAAGNVNDGADANGNENEPPSTATLRIDREPPAVVFAGSTDPADPELIAARVTDGLSGPDPARGEIAVRATGSGRPFEALPTAGAGEILLARWRSDDYPDGEYEFRVTGYDAAGNAAVGTRRANGEPMVLPNPLKARATLGAGFGWGFGERPRAWIVPRGSAVAFSGRLTMSSDASAEGRSVRVVERFGSGASEPRRTTTVTTGPQGLFSLHLDPGPSREVFAVFDGTGTSTGTTSRPLQLGVRSGVGLRASARTATVGGSPVVFRGSVAAGPGDLPSGGATVQLQFRAVGLKWTEFRTVRTDPRGRFSYRYRFSDDDSRGIRFRFRALVPTQSDWPYEPGTSTPVAVRGR